ncbi:MAG: tetratricopeptide repeat protein, partial [Gemmatimonadales bacterium]
MLALLAALSLQHPAGPCPRPWAAAAAAHVEAGWRAYRQGAVRAAEAARSFAAADSLCPGDHGAQVGLGFVLLRQGRPAEAEERFARAVVTDSSDADAWYGLGLARARRGWRAQAVVAWQRALR